METNIIFGVDIDGVCADYTAGLRRVAAKELGVDEAELPEITRWGYEQWGLDHEQFIAMHKLAVNEKHMFRDLELIDGCAESLWRLSDAGVWIRIITHRLYTNWSHETVVSDTVSWLDSNSIPFRDLCFLGAKPEVEADIYIDDAPHNINALRAAQNQVIVFDQPYNRDLEGPRANSWKEVEEIVLETAAQISGIQTQLPGIDAGADRLQRRKR